MTFFGYRLHLLVTLGGVILDFTLTTATGDERLVADALVRDYPGMTILADKGYVDDALATDLCQDGVVLLALRRTESDAGLSADADPSDPPLPPMHRNGQQPTHGAIRYPAYPGAYDQRRVRASPDRACRPYPMSRLQSFPRPSRLAPNRPPGQPRSSSDPHGSSTF